MRSTVPSGRRSQSSAGEDGRRHAGEQVRWHDHEAVVDAAQSRVGTAGAFEQRHEGVGEGRVGSQFEESR